MAKQPSNQVQLQINVTLGQQTLDFVKQHAKDGDVAGKISSWCNYYLDQQARGAILLETQDHDFLSSLNDGRRFSSSRQLVNAVSKGLKRDDGQFSSVAKIDPALITPIEDQASQMGQTVEELLTEVVNQVLVNSWSFSLEPDYTLRFTESDMMRLRKIVGKNQFFGEDLVAALEKPAELAAA